MTNTDDLITPPPHSSYCLQVSSKKKLSFFNTWSDGSMTLLHNYRQSKRNLNPSILDHAFLEIAELAIVSL